MTEDTDEPETEAAEQIESDEPDAEEAEASEDVETETDVDTDEAEVEADDGVTEDVAELQDRVTMLETENDELRAELRDVKLTYATELADGTPFEAEELADKYDFETLAEKFEDSEASLVDDSTDPADSTPAPRTGADDNAELSTTDEHADEISELESKIENYAELGWDAAKSDAEERLEALRE